MQQLNELVAEACENTVFIADDKEPSTCLPNSKDYAGAQSSIEWAEFAGGGVFEIVLAALLLMFTGGVGNVAQGVSKIRHANKLKSLGSIFRNLGKVLKRKKLRKKVSVQVDSKLNTQSQRPPAKKPKVLTSHQKAAIGEKTAHDEMVKQGHTPLGNTNGVYQPGQTGIDGVYKNASPPPDYIITEAKYGTAKLGKTADGMQMSDNWVTRSKRLEKAGLQQTDIDAIKRGLRRGDGTVEKILVRVKPDGTIKTRTIP